MAATDVYPWLVADIGGTNARFGLVRGTDGAVHDVQSFRCSEHASPQAAARIYLDALGARDGVPPQPHYASFALATVIDGDVVKMTNSPWVVSRVEIRAALALADVQLFNDFEALALALPSLGAGDVTSLGGPGVAALDRSKPMAVVGPGTGLGVAACVPCAELRWVALSTEGGHVTLAAADEFEAQVLAAARYEFAHVSAERLLSGIGLPTLHRAVQSVLGEAPSVLAPDAITQRAAAGDATCRRTIDTFCAMLGTFTGNVALTVGARGGVLVAGGIAQLLAATLATSRFRERFEAKGRFSEYLAPIATCLITAPHAALAGAAQGIRNAIAAVGDANPPSPRFFKGG